MKEKVITLIFVGIIFSFSLFTLIIKDRDISIMERRKLANAKILKDDFNENLDEYLSDQFFTRDSFLTLNSIFNRYVLNNKEYNDVYLKDDYIFEKNYPLDNNSIDNFIKKLNFVKDNYLKHNSCYYAIIPDKNYFLDGSKYLKIDYDFLYKRLNQELKINEIDFRSLLNISDYYKTDIHLQQTSYFKVIEYLSKYFDLELKDVKYEENVYKEFTGASFYKVPFSKKEELVYLNNKELNNVKVKHLEYKDNYIYKREALKSSDAYNVFLSGPSSLIEIINEKANSSKELIIFRDSFGSSLAPLLVPYYKKITLIDLRYINMKNVNNYVNFNNQDVLFLYSSLIVNNSFILKVN